MSTLGKLVPGRNSKINLAVDLTLIASALLAARPIADELLSIPGLFMGAAAAWVVLR